MSACITAIEADHTDPNIRHIYVSETCVASLTITEIEKLQIVLNKDWTEELACAIKDVQGNEKTRSIALQLISRRAWSKKELSDRLIKRGSDASAASLITEQLEEDGWLDDLAYASACIREWIRIEPASRRWLTHKLSGKGITENTATQAIDEAIGDQSEQNAATALAKLRLVKVSTLDESTQRRRVMSALQRRGFSSDTASEAIRRAT